jgi:hypothetical protein
LSVLAGFRNSKNNIFKIVLIIVNINKDKNKSPISNQFFLENGISPQIKSYFTSKLKIYAKYIVFTVSKFYKKFVK